jgi:hypothetical protein
MHHIVPYRVSRSKGPTHCCIITPIISLVCYEIVIVEMKRRFVPDSKDRKEASIQAFLIRLKGYANWWV